MIVNTNHKPPGWRQRQIKEKQMRDLIDRTVVKQTLRRLRLSGFALQALGGHAGILRKLVDIVQVTDNHRTLVEGVKTLARIAEWESRNAQEAYSTVHNQTETPSITAQQVNQIILSLPADYIEASPILSPLRKHLDRIMAATPALLERNALAQDGAQEETARRPPDQGADENEGPQ